MSGAGAAMPTAPGEHLDVGGHRLHVLCRGAGEPPVLLESGIAASSVSWAMVQPAIAAFTTCCAYDRAGFGWSDPPSTPRTFSRILDELGRVLDHAGSGQRFILVGHSFGSLVVRGLAARHPEGVAGLVLIDPPVEWLRHARHRTRMLRAGRYLSRLGAVLARVGVVRLALRALTGRRPQRARHYARVFGPTVARTLERLVGEARKLPAEVHPIVQAFWCEPKCFTAMADHMLVLQREGPVIAALEPPADIPVVVITGGHQGAEEIEAQRALAARAARGRQVIAEHSGHWILFDEPDVVVAAVRSLIG